MPGRTTETSEDRWASFVHNVLNLDYLSSFWGHLGVFLREARRRSRLQEEEWNTQHGITPSTSSRSSRRRQGATTTASFAAAATTAATSTAAATSAHVS